MQTMKTVKNHETVTTKQSLTIRATVRRTALKLLARIFAVVYDKDLRRLAKT